MRVLKTYHGSDDVTDDELAQAPITHVDGRSDPWGEAPRLFAHL